VAYVCADAGVPVFGRKGASVHVQEIVRALRRRGCAVELFVTRTGDDVPGDLVDVPVHLLRRHAGADREAQAVATNDRVERALDEAGRFDLVYERYALWSFAAQRWARRTATPSVIEVNAPLVDEQARHRDLRDRDTAERLTRQAFAAAGATVAVSEPVAAWARARHPRPCEVVVLANGVDPGRFARPRRRTAGEPFTVGFVGTLKPWHGLDVLVEAFTLLARSQGVSPASSDVRLLLVGEGPERSSVTEALTRAGLADRVTLTGAVAPAKVPPLLAEMDAAVAPYPPDADYFSPLKVLEYLAAGVPVVASRVGQVSELVAHARTGVLVPAGDAPALASALAGLAADPARAARLGAAGRADALANHTWDSVAGRILDLAGTPMAVAG